MRIESGLLPGHVLQRTPRGAAAEVRVPDVHLQSFASTLGTQADYIAAWRNIWTVFHIEGANSMYVMAVGQYLLRENLVRGKKWYSLTADYAFGHDLLKVAKRFMEGNGGNFAGDDLVPTDAADFSIPLNVIGGKE